MTTELKVISAAVFVLILIGFVFRRRKRVHIWIMSIALTVDLSVVLYLELKRGVIENLPSSDMTTLLAVHIALSVAVLVLYGVQVKTGIQKARGMPNATHNSVAFWFIAVRFGNLVTSFFLA